MFDSVKNRQRDSVEIPIKKIPAKYVEDGIKNGKHAQTIDKWKYTIKALFRFISPSTDIRDITVIDAKNWYDSISNP